MSIERSRRGSVEAQSHARMRALFDFRGSFLRFLLLGVWNAIWSFALYAFLVEWAGWNYLVSLGIVWTAGFVVSYSANFLWVFRTGPRLRLGHNALRYLLLFWGAFLANIVILWAMVERIGMPPLLAQAVVIPAVVLAHYLCARFWAFRAAPELADPADR